MNPLQGSALPSEAPTPAETRRCKGAAPDVVRTHIAAEVLVIAWDMARVRGLVRRLRASGRRIVLLGGARTGRAWCARLPGGLAAAVRMPRDLVPSMEDCLHRMPSIEMVVVSGALPGMPPGPAEAGVVHLYRTTRTTGIAGDRGPVLELLGVLAADAAVARAARRR